jgi:hypothetical protein
MIMKRASIGLFILLGILCGSVFAGELREIELIDGSVIFGEIVSFSNGVYTLKSGSLGTVQINESRIRVIRLKSHGAPTGEPASPSNTSTGTQVQALQKLMMNDKDIMSVILSLLNDPDFQEILKDPAIINAVNSGDIDALISNPKFMKLLKNPRFQEIKRKVVE